MKTLVALTKKQIAVISCALDNTYCDRENAGDSRASDNADKALRDGTSFTRAEAAALWSALSEGTVNIGPELSNREYAVNGRAMEKLERIIPNN